MLVSLIQTIVDYVTMSEFEVASLWATCGGVKAVALGGQSDGRGRPLFHHSGLIWLTCMETLLTILVTSLTIVLLDLEMSTN